MPAPPSVSFRVVSSPSRNRRRSVQCKYLRDGRIDLYPARMPCADCQPSWVKKLDEEQRIVWGEVYVPDIPDSQGDFMVADEIRKMAYRFMVQKRQDSTDVKHDNADNDCCIIESFIVRKDDPDFPIPGAWVVGMHVVEDELWEAVKSGEINGFSMQAKVHTRDKVVELDLPPSVEGVVEKTDGHEHTFSVKFDDSGEFVGGRTEASGADGHSHAILAGTITEYDREGGHRHRYSFLEKLFGEQVTEIGR